MILINIFKKYLICILFFILTLLILVGCQSKENKILEEINSLKLTADEYKSEGDFVNTIELYEKILNLKESREFRDELDSIRKEYEKVKTVKMFIKEIESIKKQKGNYSGFVELVEVLFPLYDLVEKIDNADTSRNEEIDIFITNLKKDNNYREIKRILNHEHVIKAKAYLDENKAIDKLLGSQDLQAANLMVFNTVNFNLHLAINDINLRLPEKYKNTSID